MTKKLGRNGRSQKFRYARVIVGKNDHQLHPEELFIHQFHPDYKKDYSSFLRALGYLYAIDADSRYNKNSCRMSIFNRNLQTSTLENILKDVKDTREKEFLILEKTDQIMIKAGALGGMHNQGIVPLEWMHREHKRYFVGGFVTGLASRLRSDRPNEITDKLLFRTSNLKLFKDIKYVLLEVLTDSTKNGDCGYSPFLYSYQYEARRIPFGVKWKDESVKHSDAFAIWFLDPSQLKEYVLENNNTKQLRSALDNVNKFPPQDAIAIHNRSSYITSLKVLHSENKLRSRKEMYASAIEYGKKRLITLEQRKFQVSHKYKKRYRQLIEKYTLIIKNIKLEQSQIGNKNDGEQEPYNQSYFSSQLKERRAQEIEQGR
jgi:hypothetical protein